MLQSVRFRDLVVSWPTRPTEVDGWGGYPFRFRCIVRHEGENNAQATVFDSGESMRTGAQRLTYTRGSRMNLGREGNRNVQIFPSFGRCFDPHRPNEIFIVFQRVAENLAPSISSAATTNRFGEVLPQCRNAGLGSKLEVCIGGRAQRPRHHWQESEFQLS
jgi:hypothetical protein